MRYIKTKDIDKYLCNKKYTFIHVTGSLRAMKKSYNWNKAKEIVRSGSFYYAIWQS